MRLTKHTEVLRKTNNMLINKFLEFKQNIEPTDSQIEQISISNNNIREKLSNSNIIEIIDSFLIGSYSRNTLIRPINDIDIFLKVHYGRHNKLLPKQIINMLHCKAIRIFSKSTIKSDSPCVIIDFEHCTFELIPYFAYDNIPDIFIIPNHDGSNFIHSSPFKINELLTKSNEQHDGKLIPLIKMIKNWKRKFPAAKFIKSFIIEILSLIIFNNYKIEDYPSAITYWFNQVAKLFRSPIPFIHDLDNKNLYVDKYLYDKPLKLMFLRYVINKSKENANIALNLYNRGYDDHAYKYYSKLFTDF